LDRTRNFKPTLQESETEVQLPQIRQEQKPADPKFADWQRRNSNWFNKDEEMTDAAMGLHKKLYREYGAEYLGTDDYYKRIDETMRRRFPEAFPEEVEPQKSQPKSKPSTVVASAKRSTAPKQVKLTATQAALAKKFKLTPEQYAREVLKLQEN
jgi:LysM repeat protein